MCKIEMSNEGEEGGNENAMPHCNHKYELFCIGQAVHDCAKCDPAGTVADCQKLDAAARRHGRKCSPSKGGCVSAPARETCATGPSSPAKGDPGSPVEIMGTTTSPPGGPTLPLPPSL